MRGKLAESVAGSARVMCSPDEGIVQFLHEFFPLLKLGKIVGEGLLQPVHNGVLAMHVNNTTLARRGNTVRLHQQPQVGEAELVASVVAET